MIPCSNALDAECTGGSAVVAAHLRNLRKGAGRTVEVMGYDTTEITQFHAEGLSINNRIWSRLGADVALLAEPYYLTLRARRQEVFAWLESAPVPVLAGNFLLDMADDGILGFRPTLQTQVLVDTGRFKVGFVGIMAEGTWVPTVPQDMAVTPMADFLRRAGADVVVAICQGFEGELWERSNPVWERMAGEVDVVIPPSCVVSACDEKATQYLLNGTWFLPSRASGGGMGSGRGASVEWIDFNLVGGKLEPVRAEHVSVTDPLPAALNDSAYEADAQWLESILTDANSNDPVVGYSTAPMPAAQQFAQGDSAVVVDDRCRRDFCPLGELAGRALSRAFPDVEITLSNGGAFREGWDEGPLSKRELFGGIAFPDFLCEFVTTGPELWRTTEKFLAAVNSDGSYNSSHPLRGGFPQTFGMRYEFDASRPGGQRLVNLTYFNKDRQRWEELVRTRHYRVMLPSFICDGGDSYDVMKMNGTLHRYETTIQDQVVNYVLLQNSITPAPLVSHLRLNDPRPTWALPPLTAENCTATQRFDATWDECIECPLGFVRSAAEASDCAVKVDAENKGWLWAVVAVGAALVVIGGPVGWHYSKSWRKMRRLHSANAIATNVAQSIASLRLEEVSYIKKIPHPNELQRAFAEIIDLLIEYRSYLPLSLRVEDSLQRHDTADDVSDSVTSADSDRRSTVRSGSERSLRSSRSARSTRSTKAKPPARRASLIPASSDKDLALRRVTVLWAGLSGFHKHFLPSSGPAGVTAVVDEVLGPVMAHKGILDHMSGDRFLCTFGGTRACHAQGIAAGTCALAVAKTMAAGHEKAKPYLGMDCGQCKVGTLGNSQVRKFTVVGVPVNVGYACMRMAPLYAVTTLAGARFLEDTKQELEFEPKAIWKSTKFHQKGLYPVYHLKSARTDQGAQEWMYQLEDAETGDPIAELHHAINERVQKGIGQDQLPDRRDVLEPIRAAPFNTVF